MSEVGLVGLGVMGENLSLNIASHGYSISVYNRTAERTRRFAERIPSGYRIKPTYTIQEFIESLERPRKIILMVKAGSPVDEMIEQLLPHLHRGDVIMDCGNSFFKDTERRQEFLGKHGIIFLGVGVSGGEEGALKGPSIMIGGEKEGYLHVKEVFERISAKADGEPCSAYMGMKGAGHFVKMVHNGIEYAILQLIAETYDIMKNGVGMSIEEIRDTFREWNRTELSSFLIEITTQVLSKLDEETGKPLVELILDKAEQKGTGKWTSQTAMDLGIPIPTIDAAVSSRIISSHKELRVKISKLFGENNKTILNAKSEEILELLRKSLYLASWVAYSQGLHLISYASREYSYGTDLRDVVKVWRNGCIIRSSLLYEILDVLGEDEVSRHGILFLSDKVVSKIKQLHPSLSKLLSMIKMFNIPTPAYDATHNYLISLHREYLPANIIQALRDRFGSHGYERIDKTGRFHTKWV